jgi:hypothetical protein
MPENTTAQRASGAAAGVVTAARRSFAHQAEAYRHGEARPLGGYVAVMAVFAALVTGACGLIAAGRRGLSESVRPWDVFLLTVGTHKVSRTISKDAVTSPLRAPFTSYVGSGGPAEIMEEVREGSTVRHAVGELLTCPFCLDMWVATGFTLGLVFSPRVTRYVAATFTMLTGADLLHLGYAMAQRSAEG